MQFEVHGKWNETCLFRFWTEECGKDGDCLFHVVSTALRRLLDKHSASMHGLRLRLAMSITHENVAQFVQDVLPGAASKVEKCDLASVRALVATPGWAFIGTTDVLQWLVKHNKSVGFIVLNDFGPGHSQIIGNEASRYILLYNKHNTHWQLAHWRQKRSFSLSRSKLARYRHLL